MDINVRLDEATLRRMLGEILPITVLLDEDGGSDGRWVTIDRARRLDVIPGEGVRLATSGALRWPISIVPMTVRLVALQVLLRPVVVGSGPTTRVLFRPLIEAADFERLPGFVDRGIVRSSTAHWRRGASGWPGTWRSRCASNSNCRRRSFRSSGRASTSSRPRSRSTSTGSPSVSRWT